jgi:hypothetical protein
VRALDVFTLVSGIFSILTSIPLVYLAYRSVRDGRELHRVQRELAAVIVEIGDLQRAIHRDQREARTEIVRTKETMERVAAATARRRRLPRVRVALER